MAVSLQSLRRGLARWAVRGTAVLVVEVPGGRAVRVAVEQALVARGWRSATSPADADALVVCGSPGEGWGEVLERTWAQLPGPRARASVASVEDVVGALDALATSLADDGAQRADAASRDLVPEGVEPGDDMHPAGLDLAGGEDDLRDGLEMDVLRVPLGPVLPDWPAGLVLRTVLSGDVVVRARVEVLPAAASEGRRPTSGAGADVARRLDAAAQVLRLAGADDLAAGAVRLRDAAATFRSSSSDRPRTGAQSGTSSSDRRQEGTPSRTSSTDRREHGPSVAERRRSAGVRELRGRVERSRVLAWSLPEDVRAQLLHLLDPDAHDDDPGRSTRAALDALPERLVGVDVVTARLLVAALDLRTDALDADDLTAFAPRDDEDGDGGGEDGDGGEHAGYGSHGHAHHGHAHG